MKKIILVLLIALLLSIGVCAGFIDIKDEATNDAALVLEGMGIAGGVGDGRYSPDTVLTRSQFCTLAVRMMGLEKDVNTNAQKMLFTDVKPGSWYTGYVNTAYGQGLINGYGNGKFGPDDSVTWGQVATILLRLLGYSTSDTGNVWPDDQVSYAQKLGLDKGVKADANSPISRGQAAIIIYNTLNASKKGSSSPYYQSASSVASVKDAIILDTDAQRMSGSNLVMAVLSDNSTVYYNKDKNIPADFEGKKGKLLLNASLETVGFIPSTLKGEDEVVLKADSDKITLNDGVEVKIQNNTVFVVGQNSYSSNGDVQISAYLPAKARIIYTEVGDVSHVVLLENLGNKLDKVTSNREAIILSVEEDEVTALIIDGKSTSVEHFEKLDGITQSLQGAMGKLLFNDSDVAIGFIMGAEKVKELIVDSVKLSGITDNSGKSHRIDKSALTVVNSQVYTWQDSGYLQLSNHKGKTVKLYFDEDGNVVYVYLCQGITDALTTAIMAGSVQEAAEKLGIKGSYSVTKNGVKADGDDVGQYDVAYFDKASLTLRFSDFQINGYIESAYPTVKEAQTLTVLGHEFEVLECAWDSLSKFKVGDKVTFLLTDDNKIALATTDGKIRSEMIGLLAEDGKSVTLSGSGIKITPKNVIADDTFKGTMVTVSAGYSKITCSAPKSEVSGRLDIDKKTVGTYSIAPFCQIYEYAGKNSYLYSLEGVKGEYSTSFDEIFYTKLISLENVGYCHLNSAGQIDIILLKNVTGNLYDWGKLNLYIGNDKINTSSFSADAITITNASGTSAKYISGGNVPSSAYYYGIALESRDSNYKAVASMVELKEKKKITCDSLYYESDKWYCRLDDTVIPVDGNAQVYFESTSKYLKGTDAIESALLFESKISVYYDRSYESGAKVRLIIVHK